MPERRLKRPFFLRPTLTVAKQLLGKYLVHEYQGRKLAGMIVETEAYVGTKDRASHAFGGRRTRRNEVEYGPGGHIYIYLVYGLHWQLNFVTGPADQPECVLIRALQPADGIDYMRRIRKVKQDRDLANGPGKLCQALKLDHKLYGYDLCQPEAKIYLEDRGVRPKAINQGPRVGIDYAGPYWAKVPWRYWLKPA